MTQPIGIERVLEDMARKMCALEHEGDGSIYDIDDGAAYEAREYWGLMAKAALIALVDALPDVPENSLAIPQRDYCNGIDSVLDAIRVIKQWRSKEG